MSTSRISWLLFCYFWFASSNIANLAQMPRITPSPIPTYTLPKRKKRMESWRLIGVELLTSPSNLHDFSSLNALFKINPGQVKEWSIYSCWNKKTTRKNIKFTLESIDETTKYGDQYPCNRLALQRVEMSCNHKYKGLTAQIWLDSTDCWIRGWI